MLALGMGSQLTVSSFTITPTHDVHHVEGQTNDTINTIIPPNPSFCGMLTLIFDFGGSAAIFTDGNIAFAKSVSEGQAVVLIYDPNTEKWYPVF